MGDLT